MEPFYQPLVLALFSLCHYDLFDSCEENLVEDTHVSAVSTKRFLR